MLSLSANEAKTQFGEMLLKVQAMPVQINKNGKPVAVVISIEEFETMERMKLDMLKLRANNATLSNSVNGTEFFSNLLK